MEHQYRIPIGIATHWGLLIANLVVEPNIVLLCTIMEEQAMVIGMILHATLFYTTFANVPMKS